MKIPPKLLALFRADLAKAQMRGTKPQTIITIWVPRIRDEMGAAWGGKTEHEIRIELDRIEEGMK